MIPLPDTVDALAALEWQIELGADEAIGDTPVNRLAPVVEEAAPVPAAEASQPANEAALGPTPGPTSGPTPGPTSGPAPGAPADAGAAALAASCADLPALRAAIEAFEGCPLKKGARSTVFSDGNPAARVMIIGEAPGRDEDLQGKPFVGRSGQLLDRMLAAIGLSRASEDANRAVYITNVLPWRPPQNREPSTDEMLMLRAFLERHVALAAPQLLVTMGNSATKTVLEVATGITRMRGRWAEYEGIPVMPMLHPAALLRNPAQKREAWADLQALQKRLNAL